MTMKKVDTRNHLEWMDRDECLALVAADHVGRLAVLDGHAPLILPINYVLDGDDIVFRSDPGTKLDQGPRSPACFEIDAFDRASRSGWSVVIRGRLEEVTRYDTTTLQRLQSLPIDPWAEGAKEHWMRLASDSVSGRKVGPYPPSGAGVSGGAATDGGS